MEEDTYRCCSHILDPILRNSHKRWLGIRDLYRGWRGGRVRSVDWWRHGVITVNGLEDGIQVSDRHEVCPDVQIWRVKLRVLEREAGFDFQQRRRWREFRLHSRLRNIGCEAKVSDELRACILWPVTRRNEDWIPGRLGTDAIIPGNFHDTVGEVSM